LYLYNLFFVVLVQDMYKLYGLLSEVEEDINFLNYYFSTCSRGGGVTQTGVTSSLGLTIYICIQCIASMYVSPT